MGSSTTTPFPSSAEELEALIRRVLREEFGALFQRSRIELELERELESLRNNEEFIAFLDARAKEPTISLEEARQTLLGPDI